MQIKNVMMKKRSVKITKDEEMLIDEELERAKKELQDLIDEEAMLDRVSAELDKDLLEMSRHQVYSRYAYMSLEEIQ